MKLSSAFLLLLISLSCIPIAGAVEEINQYHIKDLNIDAPTDKSFSTFELLNIEPNSKTNLSLNCYGETYLLNVSANKNYGLWSFDVSITYPNMTVESKHVSSLAPFANSYNLGVQSYWWNFNNTVHEALDLNLYTTVRPLTINTIYYADPLGSGWITQAMIDSLYDPQALPFSSIGIISSSFYDATFFVVTADELKAQQERSVIDPLLHGGSTTASTLFKWTWEGVLSFVGLIPFIGDNLVTALEIAGSIIETIFYFFKLLFFDYSETTILSLEFFIIAYSVHRTKSKSPIILCKNVMAAHIAVYSRIFAAVKFAFDLLTNLISTVAHIVNGLKPI
jgi:hypothetical protein